MAPATKCWSGCLVVYSWVYDLSTFYIRCWENGNTQTHMHTRKVCIGIKYRSLHMLNMFTTELFPNLLNGELKIWAFQDNVIRLHIMNRSLKKRSYEGYNLWVFYLKGLKTEGEICRIEFYSECETGFGQLFNLWASVTLPLRCIILFADGTFSFQWFSDNHYQLLKG